MEVGPVEEQDYFVEQVVVGKRDELSGGDT